MANQQAAKSASGEANQSKPQAGNSKSSDNQQDNQSIKATGNEILGQVKDTATGLLDEQKTNLTSGLTGIADSIKKVGDNLRESGDQNTIGKMTAQYGNDLARRIEDFSSYIDNADFKAIARDVEKFARQQPALFIGGAFTLGLLAARFLKTSRPNQTSTNRLLKGKSSDRETFSQND